VKNNALKVNEKDNVAIATQFILAGSQVIVDGEQLFTAAEDIQPGHKIALVPLQLGESVLRYGEPIVQTIRAMGQGE